MNYIHGYSARALVDSTYMSWYSMLQRCENSKNARYKNYGERGIKVCAKWHDFKAFLNDMGDRPAGLTLDRIDNDGDYTPSNCRWASGTVQNLNSRVSKRNTSGVKGVSWKKQIHRWVARGQLHGVDTLLYCGQDFDAACEARFEWEDYAKATTA